MGIKFLKTTFNRAYFLKSLRIGMLAFILTFGMALILSTVFNVMFLSLVNEIVRGAIGTSDRLTLSGLLKTTSFIMNVSIFNHVGDLRFGIMIFAGIPLVSFFVANRQDNKTDGLNLNHVLVYACSALVYATLILFEALVSKGTLLGVKMDFFTLSNFLSAWVLAFFVQIVIGLNYDSHGIEGVKAAKWLFWLLLGLSCTIGFVGMFYVLGQVGLGLSARLIMTLLVLPNLAVYILFMLMGIDMALGESMVSLLAIADMNVAFTALPSGIKVLALTGFAIVVLWLINRMQGGRLLKETFIFALCFSSVTLFAAFGTTITLGTVVILKEVHLGVPLLKAFFIPFLIIMALGLLLKLIQELLKTLQKP